MRVSITISTVAMFIATDSTRIAFRNIETDRAKNDLFMQLLQRRVAVTVETDQLTESEADKLAKRFLGRVHKLNEPSHQLRGAY